MVEAIIVTLIPAFFAFITLVANNANKNYREDIIWYRNQVLPLLERQMEILEQLVEREKSGNGHF